MGTPVLRVLIIAGDPLARSGLAHILADQSGLCVVGQATMHADLSAEFARPAPDERPAWPPCRAIGSARFG